MNRPGYSPSRECGEVNILGFSPTLRWIITLTYTDQWIGDEKKYNLCIFMPYFEICKQTRNGQLFRVSDTISASPLKFTRRIMFRIKTLPWKTLKQNFVAFFVLIGMAFSYISEVWASGNRDAMLSISCAVMWAGNILGYSWIGNQSERAKNTIHWFGIC